MFHVVVLQHLRPRVLTHHLLIGQIKVLVPVIIVVVIARFVARRIYPKGIFEAVMEFKNHPYLESENPPVYYEAVQVKDIMSLPPLEILNPRERVGDLVKLLERTEHNGFLVVEKNTRRFLGLVKRVQIAALLECGVFSKKRKVEREEDLVAAAYGINVSGDDRISEGGPLMHYAYRINDDRYDHILAIPDEDPAGSKMKMFCSSRSTSMQSTPSRHDEESDELRDRPAYFMLTKEQREVNESIRMSLMATPTMRTSSTSSSSSFSLPQEFCTVTRNDAGNVVVSWYNTEFDQYWVDLASVANRGTYTVPEFCPVSKAYTMCEFELVMHVCH